LTNIYYISAIPPKPHLGELFICGLRSGS